jgi:hypothetical protein
LQREDGEAILTLQLDVGHGWIIASTPWSSGPPLAQSRQAAVSCSAATSFGGSIRTVRAP